MNVQQVFAETGLADDTPLGIAADWHEDRGNWLAAKLLRDTLNWNFGAMQRANAAAGFHWFSRDTMRFFKTRLLGQVRHGPAGIFFVTSEKDPFGNPRSYTVRQWHPQTAKVSTVGEVGDYKYATTAKRAAQRLAAGLE